jgi:hypothetical protein
VELLRDVPSPLGKSKFHGTKKEGSVGCIRSLDLSLVYIRAELITVLPRPYGDPAEIAVLT